MTTPGSRSGRFVTFEGIEGSGKTTQIARLAERFRAAGDEVVLTREPGGTALGRQLRGVLLLPAEPPMSAEAELLLYAADRAQHLVEVVEPALVRGALVLCDRYLDAALRRARARDAGDTALRQGRFEAESLAFHRRVRDGYLALAAAEPGRFRVVDARGESDEVAARVRVAAADLSPCGAGGI
jgi:dTMP kinase